MHTPAIKLINIAEYTGLATCQSCHDNDIVENNMVLKSQRAGA